MLHTGRGLRFDVWLRAARLLGTGRYKESLGADYMASPIMQTSIDGLEDM